jgi:hypothetical protein
MRRLPIFTLCLASILATSGEAAVSLIARGTLGGSTDLSGLTGAMENGLPGNVLGGLGSGLTYAGGSTFLSVPDRGPNATPYNSAVDNTVSYISRFQTLDLSLSKASVGSPLPFDLTPTLTNTTLLFSQAPLNYGTGAGLGNKIDGVTPIGSGAPAQNDASHYYFSGRSDNFNPSTSSTDPTNARFDPESIRMSNDGKSVFISDEYGPNVRQFDRATGQLVKTFAVPDNLAVANQSAFGNDEIPGLSLSFPQNTSGRVANKGMEGLALTPDGKTLVGIMQAPLIQDAADPATSKLLRIVAIDMATGATKEYGYNLTTGSGVSDIVALNDHEFLVDERDGKGLGDGSNAKVKQIFKIDIAGATDIAGLTGAGAEAAAVPKSSSPILDIVAQLGLDGITKDLVPAKIEGISFGGDVWDGSEWLHTLYVANDNDFLPDTAGSNQFFVFGFTDTDLPGYVPQAFSAGVPEPASWAMMIGGFGLIGAALRRRKANVNVRFV